MSPNRRLCAAAALVLAAGVVLRARGLGAFPGLNPDETEIALQWLRSRPILWYVAPSGRPHLDPLGPLLLLPLFWARPAAWVVRAPALLAGLALFPSAWLSFRRAFGPVVALSAAALAFALPLHLAYSRVGWDPAFVPAAAAAALGLAFRRRWAAAAPAAALLALIHPTTVFLLPLLAAPALRDRPRRPAGWLIAAAAFAAAVPALRALFGPLAEPGARTAAGFLDYLAGLGRVLDGSGVYAGFLGDGSATAASWGVAALPYALAGAAVLCWVRRRRDELALLLALPVALLFQYLVQGRLPVETLNERYVLWAGVPVCVAAAAALRAWAAELKRPRAAAAASLALATGLLASFRASYLRPFMAGGGRSLVLDYRAAAAQPRERVLELVRRERRRADAPAVILVGDARLHMGLLYLASRDAGLDVRCLAAPAYRFQGAAPADPAPLAAEVRAKPRDVFLVDWAWDEGLGGAAPFFSRPAGGSLARLRGRWSATKVETVRASDGAPLITVWRLSPGAAS